MKTKKGFSLMEVMVATSLLGVLITIAVPFLNSVNNASIKGQQSMDAMQSEFSQINEARAIETESDLLKAQESLSLIEITKDSRGRNLYLVKGKSSNVTAYITLKS